MGLFARSIFIGLSGYATSDYSGVHDAVGGKAVSSGRFFLDSSGGCAV
jgi:hypothetical protein